MASSWLDSQKPIFIRAKREWTWRVSVKQKRPRHLTPRQAERFVKILTGAPQRSIIIDALLGDQKARIFATQLQFLFLTA